MWWPLITGALPTTSVATLRKGLPAVGIETWSDIMNNLVLQYPSWDNNKKAEFQAEVADESPDIAVGRYLANLVMGVGIYPLHFPGTLQVSVVRVQNQAACMIFSVTSIPFFLASTRTLAQWLPWWETFFSS